LYCVRAPLNPVRHCAIYHRRMGICAFVGIAPVETLHATSLPPNRCVCMVGASIVMRARPAKPCAVSCHLPPLDRYLYVCWCRDRRDVACNVSTPPGRCACMDGASIVLRARLANPRAVWCHLPPPNRYLCVCWCRDRRDVACNVSTPPGRRVCVDGELIVLCACPAKPCAVSCHFPPSDRYFYVGWYHDRRDVACNVSTTKTSYTHGRCFNCITCAPRQILCGVVPFTPVGSIFVRWLVSRP
jgi:hypothetical protein